MLGHKKLCNFSPHLWNPHCKASQLPCKKFKCPKVPCCEEAQASQAERYREGKGSVLGANSQLPPSELWFHLPNFFSSSTFPPSFSHSNQSTAAINVTQHAAVNSSVQFCRTSENIPRIWLSADETCLNYPHYLPLHIPYALFVFLMLGGGGWIVTKKKKNLQIEERRTSSQKYIHNCKSG